MAETPPSPRPSASTSARADFSARPGFSGPCSQLGPGTNHRVVYLDCDDELLRRRYTEDATAAIRSPADPPGERRYPAWKTAACFHPLRERAPISLSIPPL